VLVHGYTAFPEEMRPLGEDLAAAGHTVLAIRLAGHGTDPRDLARVRLEDWVADVAEGVALLAGAERVVLVGQSLGALVVLAAAADLPVAGVVTLSVPFGMRPRVVGPARLRPKDAARHPELGLRRERDYPAYAAGHTHAEREMGRLARLVEKTVPRLACPVLVVSSDVDPWFPGEFGRRLHEALPGRKELLVVRGPGHAVSYDPQRGEAVEAILRFAGSL
jgi:carboxylesterase